MKIYLAGPINGCSDSEAKGWRAEAARLFSGHKILDPMVRDYRGLEAAAFKEIVEGDKKDIDECDVLLVMFERPSVGTSMEILYAWERGKKVIVVDRSGKPLSPWLLYHSSHVASSLEDALRSF